MKSKGIFCWQIPPEPFGNLRIRENFFCENRLETNKQWMGTVWVAPEI